MTGPRFAVVGDNTIDRYTGAEREEYVGGNAANVAVQLVLAGEDVEYFGAVGDDADGGFIRAVLEAAGVGVGGLVTMDGPTAVTRIRVEPDGDRVFEQEDFGVTADYFPSVQARAAIDASDWLQIGMLRGAERLRREAPNRVGQDCAVTPGFEGLDVAFLSAGDDDPVAVAAAAMSGGAGLAVVTRGAAGSFAWDGSDEPVEVGAMTTRVVDTTGAGDSFIAGFLSAFVRGADPQAALGSGARRAALTCGHRAGFPQRGRAGV